MDKQIDLTVPFTARTNDIDLQVGAYRVIYDRTVIRIIHLELYDPDLY